MNENAMRYRWPLNYIQTAYAVFFKGRFSVHNALSVFCLKGGFIHQRRDENHDLFSADNN